MKTFNISAGIALVFFVLGTLLFLLQLVSTNMNELPLIGFYYLVIAVIVNSLVLITLLGKLFIDTNYTETFKSIGIILANIPIAVAYAYIVIEYALH